MSTIQQFDFSVDLEQVILWQYDNAPTINSLIAQKQAWYTENEMVFWTNWLRDVFNLVTANDFGLSVWAIILNVPLFFNLDQEPTEAPFIGFNAYVPSFPTLENTYWNFYGSTDALGANFTNAGDSVVLTTEEQRFLLRLKYFDLISRGAIPEINIFLNYLCLTSPEVTGGGTAYVLEGFNMTMRYIFTFALSYNVQQILRQFDILPHPAGVLLEAVMIITNPFGFNAYDPAYPDLENNYSNFNNSNFYSGFF